MTNYCTNQWTIVKFPCGAGGKFLSNCLFLFDKVAHWHGIDNQQATVAYFKQTILSEGPWLKRELNHRWGISFFSRSYERNNLASADEFNDHVELHSSEYFKQCWDKGLDIVDHWAKPYNPIFWESAKKINITIDDYDLYKKLAINKLYRIQDDKIISLLDTPSEVGTAENLKYTQQFNNQYEFAFTSVDDFFADHVEKLPWLSPWLSEPVPDNELIITNSELIDYSKFSQKFEAIEDLYQEQIPRIYLKELHSTWNYATDQYTN
jgi:hypothetical protein